jgi:hypothetical protein
MIVREEMGDAGADRPEDTETPEFLACSRNIFRDRPSELLTLCRARDAIARTCDIQALTDAGLLHRQPFAFVSQSTTEYFYTVANRIAAATAVQLALSPRYASGPCPSTVWTDEYWVPVGQSTPTATAKELRALETLRHHPADPLTLVDGGTLHHDDAIRLLVGMKTTS